MILSPFKIYQNFQHNTIDRESAIKFLITLIENSETNQIRIDSIKYLAKIGKTSIQVFEIFENLLICDSSWEIRKLSALYIRKFFLNKALSPIKWAIQHEIDYNCMILLIKTLVEINTPNSREILIEELQKIRQKEFIDDNKNYSNENFKESLDLLLQKKKIESLTSEQLAEIIINHKTIAALINKFYTVYFEWQDALISRLDLSEIGWNVWNVWRQKYADRIIYLSEIIGLNNLKQLKVIDLSNNRIRKIKDLLALKNLTHLFISNNRIENIENLDYLKKMKNLRYLDISGNKIATMIPRKELFNIELTLVKGLPFI
jgi:Leucine-rich repeat (LRR) protein